MTLTQTQGSDRDVTQSLPGPGPSNNRFVSLTFERFHLPNDPLLLQFSKGGLGEPTTVSGGPRGQNYFSVNIKMPIIFFTVSIVALTMRKQRSKKTTDALTHIKAVRPNCVLAVIAKTPYQSYLRKSFMKPLKLFILLKFNL